MGGRLEAPVWIDPTGAQEFYCNDIWLEQLAPGIVRARMLCREGRETILRCTLILPESALQTHIGRTRAFMYASTAGGAPN